MAVTTNYSWAYPTVNADADVWGTTLNAAIVAIDASLHTVETAAPKIANNLSDMTAATCRTNLGLGSAATLSFGIGANGVATIRSDGVADAHIAIFGGTSGIIADSGITYTDVLTKSGNLSGLGSAATSRTNLGLGSIATHNVTISLSAPSGGSDGDIWLQYT